jgi:adenine/guanine/hypoxanthine permease
MKTIIEKYFKLQELNTSIRTEVIAGATTFMTMAYIIFVNPSMISKTGLDFGAAMTATCISAAIATIMMGVYANYPIALAPGMGQNAFFTYTVCLTMGIAWQTALGCVWVDRRGYHNFPSGYACYAGRCCFGACDDSPVRARYQRGNAR